MTFSSASNHHSLRSGRVIADHQSTYPDPLVISAGEMLTVGDNDSQWPGFVWCTNQSGKGGWVPKAYLDRDNDTATARCDYSAVELTVTIGEQLALLKEEGGWAWCSTQDGRLGWVPLANLEIE